MTKSQIISLADTRTEKRGKTLDMPLEFLNALQEFCLESRFYWRRKTVTFNTVAGTATYDLSTSSADVEEIIEAKYIKSATCKTDLIKIFDHSAQDEIIESTTTGEPGSVFIDPGTAQTIRISPIPSGVFKIRVSYWAIPNFDPGQTDDSVPLVPAWLHRTVAKLLERNILGFLFGEEASRFTRADAEYQKQLQQAMGVRDGMVGKIVEWKSRECAVRST